MNILTYDALSINVGIGSNRPDKPDGTPTPEMTLNFQPSVAHELAERFLLPYAKPEHCLVGFDLGHGCCEVTIWLLVPTPHGLVAAGNVADISLDSIGRFLDAKAKFNHFALSLGYHQSGQEYTRKADVSWHLILSEITTGETVSREFRRRLFGDRPQHI